MHIPDYARAMIRSALPTLPTARQVEALNCCLCDSPFEDRLPVPLGPTRESGLFGCYPCLTRLVSRARRARDATLTQNAEQAAAESAAWVSLRGQHLARLDGVRQAADAVAELAERQDIEPLRIAWVLISLESAYTWLPDAPEPPASADREESGLRDEMFKLNLAMIAAREAVAERLAYHLINAAQPEEPEMCEGLECQENRSGRHDSSHIDCGPNDIFEQLAKHGLSVDLPEPAPLPPRVLARFGTPDAEDTGLPLPGIEEQAPKVLAHFGIDASDTDVLVSAAAVGLVFDAWREGPMEDIHAADDGPSDGEIYAQSVDLYRRARTALIAARDEGPEALLAFAAIASDVNLPWAGGSRFALRTVAESVEEFVQHVDDRVWFTTELIRAQGWHAALLHRACSAAFKATHHFGMPGWPDAVAATLESVAAPDRADIPEALTDFAAVETSLLEAPDQLGAEMLDWISHANRTS
ncbi:hypothetical protein N4G70_04005 [Streptomyces sp. ASQP_92]|uniref:hypothetical protein n=1 Tax=Streptomyces sp. ASQP_92 TaxID=2979116 RepID=UPI0021C2365E|nr:hypothetical protein [Streptomyces sp. ASQP_92]MCT9088022.1 hypothetical protein [Streptomyces sp. ASQP_92]